jgi:F-type H+-transporting ATPase subunit epsilon
MPASFPCTVVTPERKLLETQARYVQLPGWDGQIGIAPGRALLMVKLGTGRLRIDTEAGESQTLYVGGGFAQMKGNVLSVLADEAMPADEVDRAQAERLLRESTQAPAPAGPAMERRDRQAERARAMLAATR